MAPQNGTKIMRFIDLIVNFLNHYNFIINKFTSEYISYRTKCNTFLFMLDFDNKVHYIFEKIEGPTTM